MRAEGAERVRSSHWNYNKINITLKKGILEENELEQRFITYSVHKFII